MFVRVGAGDKDFSLEDGIGMYVPRAGTLAVATRAGVPDGFVRHIFG